MKFKKHFALLLALGCSWLFLGGCHRYQTDLSSQQKTANKKATDADYFNSANLSSKAYDQAMNVILADHHQLKEIPKDCQGQWYYRYFDHQDATTMKITNDEIIHSAVYQEVNGENTDQTKNFKIKLMKQGSLKKLANYQTGEIQFILLGGYKPLNNNYFHDVKVYRIIDSFDAACQTEGKTYMCVLPFNKYAPADVPNNTKLKALLFFTKKKNSYQINEVQFNSKFAALNKKLSNVNNKYYQF